MTLQIIYTTNFQSFKWWKYDLIILGVTLVLHFSFLQPIISGLKTPEIMIQMPKSSD